MNLADIFHMELTQAQLNSLQALTLSPGKIKSDNLAIGQQILAKIAAVNPETGEVTLKINDTLVTAKTILQLTAGQTLQLTVAQSNANKVVLQLPQILIDAITSQKALREALPRQQPITDTIIQLKSLATSNTATQLPDKILQLAKNFVSKLPTPAQLSTATGVKQAIQQSGVFLENKLSNILHGQTGKSIDGDIKALLLGLKSALSSTLSKEKDTQAILKSATPLTESAKQLQTSTLQSSAIKSLLSNPLTRSANLNLAIAKTPEPSSQQAPQQVIQQTTQQISDQFKYKKIIDIRAIEASIAEVAKSNGGNIPTDKQLTDKQIQQILSNLLGQQKSQSKDLQTTQQKTGATLNTTLPLPSGAIKPAETNPAGLILKTAQQYSGKTLIAERNEMALSAIKSQHVSEASTPRMNSLIDLIETLIKQVDSAISRTQVHQLNTMQDQESGKLAMSFEIPVNDDDNLHLVQLHIEKEPGTENDTETVVTVNLAIDLDAIGPVYARITLINDNTSVVLWAERDTTFQLVQESVDTLHEKLESSGLKSDNIACHHGQPPQSRFVKTEVNNNLVDVRA
ncbi:MAG: flagellar hook-length control protein FliK [Gammaproteobacteria bacterium]|nr:flagellar hook-length control protein FliK [Gammaproteobacteria bacterium]